MALKLIEGFDHFTGTGTTPAAKGWQLSDSGDIGAVAIAYVTGRITGNAVRITYSGSASSHPTFQKALPAAYTNLVLGFAFNVNGLPNAGQTFVLATLQVGATQTCRVILNDAGHIRIDNSSGTTIATGTATVTSGAYHYVEVKLVINGGSGSVATQVNGAADIATTTGNFGSTGVDRLVFYPNSKGNVSMSNLTQAFVDDVYLLDNSGGVNTTFLGDVHVETVEPSADGNYTQWTPNSGSDHYSRVNETAVDADTSYVSDATVGHIDTYQYTDLVIASGTVFGVQTNLWSRKDDAVVRKIAPVFRIGGTDYVGSDVTLATSYVDGTQIYDKSPATSAAWTITEINGAEAGVKVTL